MTDTAIDIQVLSEHVSSLDSLEKNLGEANYTWSANWVSGSAIMPCSKMGVERRATPQNEDFFWGVSQEPAHQSIKIEGQIIQGIKDEIAAVSRQHVRRHQNKKTQSAGVGGRVGYIT